MPPRKRSPGDPESARRSDRATSEAKRRRVSLACDACRTAREKCDGERPRCGRCVSQKRSCSYTPTSKKRGIQSGYLRAIELSLAWLLESVPGCEEALYQLLVKDGGKDGVSVLVSKGRSSSRLQKRWSKCRIHHEIETLLCRDGTSQGEAPVAEGSDADDDTMEESVDETTQRVVECQETTTASLGSCLSLTESRRAQVRALKLPSDYRHLLDIYFAYTHCWYPILDPDDVAATADTLASLSLTTHDYMWENNTTSSNLAVLWSALAVAAFQDAQSSAPSMSEEVMSPTEILAVARSLVPQEEDQFDIPGIQALLLHAIILVGRENMLAASITAGKSLRLITYMRSSRVFQALSEMQKSLLGRLAAACNVVEALTSTCIGQPSHLLETEELQANGLDQGGSQLADSFSPIYGFGRLSMSPDLVHPQAAHPLVALDQLSRFARILSTHATGKLQKDSSVGAVTVGDLVSSLDPQFGFCNSVIAGEATPMLPSAFLAQAMFLATTVELVPGQRSSLISNFLEVVESSISNFGACGTPPITVALFSLVQQKGAIGEMRTSEADRWNSASNAIRAVWLQDETTKSTTYISPETSTTNNGSWRRSLGSEPLGQSALLSQRNEDPQERSFSRGYEFLPADMDMPTRDNLYPANRHKRSPAQLPPPLGLLFSPDAGATMQPVEQDLQNGHSQADGVDYDAILEELGNIDYAESIGMDPQFMMNLGFAPGCTLEEMFHMDSGIT
ncbi:hypothetical protein M440DRAFT_1405285 [Trichoderma longibrachiatum ATCC 18648]|uniref:Zn(2)-C6 fungal-type domain-containing protein n=1 Tax=Trichoderma longibrachiatum ATCC 18648 TaxID=983965 RepID=A0A2T4BU45_TRILO|nr:hypothetical protein M440DRAFT_1405285 [Trichoderma longibrachiatum ATCC 18648]